MSPVRYYVRREECWGGTYLWFVADRDGHLPWQANCVRIGFRTERTAKAHCERANRDWNTFMNGGKLTRGGGLVLPADSGAGRGSVED